VNDEALFVSALESVKAQDIQAIKAQRDDVTADYIVIDGNQFHSDANSRIQKMSLNRMGQAQQNQEGLMWQAKNNGMIEQPN
ncbi:hypothetical protein AIZ15_24650, partial [Salmonella enterica subsp. enterica serovar Typhimurium]|uniref:DUF4376 domain-containing protein n=1 Tax=Salmonella enterica TaxID=28901 RepID=UPI0007915275